MPKDNLQAYKDHPDIKNYVDKYASQHHISVEEACEHVIVDEYITEYLNNELN